MEIFPPVELMLTTRPRLACRAGNHLLTVLVVEGWSGLGERLTAVREDALLSPTGRVRAACRAMVDLGVD